LKGGENHNPPELVQLSTKIGKSLGGWEKRKDEFFRGKGTWGVSNAWHHESFAKGWEREKILEGKDAWIETRYALGPKQEGKQAALTAGRAEGSTHEKYSQRKGTAARFRKKKSSQFSGGVKSGGDAFSAGNNTQKKGGRLRKKKENYAEGRKEFIRCLRSSPGQIVGKKFAEERIGR